MAIAPQTYYDVEDWILTGPSLPHWANLSSGGELRITGSAGADLISITDEAGQVRVQRNSDTVLVAGVSSVRIYGEGGSDAITMQSMTIPGVLYGQEGDDTIIGGAAGDLIFGGDGNDVIRAAAGRDTVYGNFGDDDIDGGDGADSLWQAWAMITFAAGRAPTASPVAMAWMCCAADLAPTTSRDAARVDSIYGGEKNDTIYGGAGADLIDGGEGDDWINVDATPLFHDTVYGGAGNDTVRADADDLLFDVEVPILS